MTQANDLRATASAVKNSLLSQLATQRNSLGLSQADLADRAGTSRMTVQRCESEDADTNLSTFTALALALNLTPRLLSGAGEGDSELTNPASENIVHRGTHHNRTRHDLDWRDRQREAALAKAWEAANRHSEGLAPILKTLVPGHTQEQATAVATAMQWLGSEIGFDFLVQALGQAGYTLSDSTAAGKRK